MELLPYCNVLEQLVAEEVQRQLQSLPPDLVFSINPDEAIAYALNRLPALYASSEEGWNRQQQKAKTQLAEQIVLAAKWGLNTVFQNPLRHSTPLRLNHPTADKSDKQVLTDVNRGVKRPIRTYL
jgi:Late competence development protein ComFB